MPSHGMRITKMIQSVFPPPPRSLLRKMSPNTQNRHMNQAKNRKNSKSASRNDPLSLNILVPFGVSCRTSLRPVMEGSEPCSSSHETYGDSRRLSASRRDL